MKSMQIFPDSRGLYTRTKFFKFSEIICMVICIYTHWLMNYFTEKPKPCHSFLLELLEVLLTKNEPDPYLAEVRNAILKPAGNLTQNLSDYDFLWKHLLFIAVLQMLFIFFFFCMWVFWDFLVLTARLLSSLSEERLAVISQGFLKMCGNQICQL